MQKAISTNVNIKGSKWEHGQGLFFSNGAAHASFACQAMRPASQGGPLCSPGDGTSVV